MLKIKKYSLYFIIPASLVAGLIYYNQIRLNNHKYDQQPVEQNGNPYGSYLVARHALYNLDFNKLSKEVEDLEKVKNKEKSISSLINISSFLSGNFNSKDTTFNKDSDTLFEYFINFSYLFKDNKFNQINQTLFNTPLKIFTSMKIWTDIGLDNYKNALKTISESKESQNWKNFELGMIANYNKDNKEAITYFKKIKENYININDFIYIYSFYKNNNINENINFPIDEIDLSTKKTYQFNTIQQNLAFSIISYLSHHNSNESILSLTLLRTAEFLYPEYTPTYYYLALYFFNQNNWVEFDKNIEKIQKDSFLYEIAQLKSAEKDFILNNKNSGYKKINNLIKENPNFYPAITNLVFNYIQDDKTKEAFNILNNLSKNKEISDKNRGLILKLKSHLYLLNNQNDLSEISLFDALYYLPNEISIINDLMYVWAKQNKNLDEADKLMSSIIKNNPQNTAFWDTLAYISLKKQDYQFAKNIWNKVSNASDANSVLFEHMGDLYYELENKNEAKKHYKKALELKSDGFINTKNIEKKLKKL